MATRPLQPGRSNPVTRVTPKAILEDTKQKIMEDEFDEESCKNIDQESCLMKRTLVAHTDYIYTQNHGQP